MKENETKRIKYIPYRGVKLRDDRMYVFNITKGKLENHSSKGVEVIEGYWVMHYKNTLELPLSNKKFFDTKEEAEQSVRFNEPLTPLISNYEEPYSIFKGEDGWELWNDWLNFRGLHSAVSGYQNFTFDMTPEGGSFTIVNNYTDVWIENGNSL